MADKEPREGAREAVAEETTAATAEDEPREARRRRGTQDCVRPRCKREVVYTSDGVATEPVSYCRVHLPVNITRDMLEAYAAGR